VAEEEVREAFAISHQATVEQLGRGTRDLALGTWHPAPEELRKLTRRGVLITFSSDARSRMPGASFGLFH
jgi:hypothetical protein